MYEPKPSSSDLITEGRKNPEIENILNLYNNAYEIIKEASMVIENSFPLAVCYASDHTESE